MKPIRLAGILILLLLGLCAQPPPAKKYDFKTMTVEEIDAAAAADGRYDFDIAPADGLIDNQGRTVTAAELPAYLRENALAPTAFYYLWITPLSRPLNRLTMLDQLATHGVTKIIVRHRPDTAANSQSTPPPDPADPARFARAASLTGAQLDAFRTELEAIHRIDQEGRIQAEAVAKTSGFDSPEVKDLWARLKITDAKNLARVTAILDEYGWLGPSEVGGRASGALFLAIQHSNLPTQKYYLPMMRAAVTAGKARGSSLALLEDRIALGEGRPQTYGSQIGRDNATGKFFVRPLLEPETVDQRRAALGMQPLAEYVKQWSIVWDVEVYKQQLPELMNQLRPAVRPAR